MIETENQKVTVTKKVRVNRTCPFCNKRVNDTDMDCEWNLEHGKDGYGHKFSYRQYFHGTCFRLMR